ncbi:hypothetical protein ZEAMMB73_Zm00001d019933 [Zea mays]|uniref:Uncharacterized protein n=1 Tax=Zea mays TaxID=4577 RepID=A0A1D6I137_MAIZE|nr:hypothetical protein ZEAMMB73_Zm00001d019933 [Zea mays]
MSRRKNTVLALVAWIMLLALFITTATASLPFPDPGSPILIMDAFHFISACQCCWLVQHPKVTCGHACCGDNCCPPTPPPSTR